MLSPALTRLLQGLLSALAVAGSLWLVAAALGYPFARAEQALALVAGLGAFLVFHRQPLLAPWRPDRTDSAGARVLRRWLWLAGVLLLIGYASDALSRYPRALILGWLLLAPLALRALYGVSALLARRLGRRRTAVLVFASEAARDLAQRLHDSPAYELVGYFEDRDPARGGALDGVAWLGRAQDVAGYVRDRAIDAVFVVLPDDGGRRALDLLERLGETASAVYCVPDFAILHLFQAAQRETEGVLVLEASEPPFWGAGGLLKRGSDLLLATLGLLLFAPLLALVALAVRLGSPGPVLVRHKRYGLNGQRFGALKFRTTPSGRGAEAPTRFGRFLRRSAIDELPQLVNVLRGEMSVVGPRAQTVAHNEFYRQAIRGYLVRHRVRPGLTGWAQVHGLHGDAGQVERIEDRVRYDLDYLRNWSPLLDLRILLMTFAQLLRGR